MATAFDLINGTYITIYARAADPKGAAFWANSLGFSSLAAASAEGTASLALADKLGPAFYAASSAVFNATYPTTILDSQFINKLYLNLGGLPPDAAGSTFWLNRLTALEGSNPVQVARSIVATEIAFVLQTYDPSATGDAAIRAQTFKNKITVSGNVVNTGNASFNPASQSMSDPAYAGETNILLGINQTAASLNTALAQVNAANAANNPALMVGQPVVGVNYTLTTAIETVPPQGVLNPNDTVSGVTDATGNTFQTGDTINGWNVPGTANNNVVSILDTGTGAAVTATVNNVARINHTLLGPQTYNEALYTNVGQEWVTNGAGGATLTVNSANAATTYGISSGTAVNLTLTYAGATGQTATFALANAGLVPATGASTASAINVAGGANISTVSLVTTGKNAVSVNGGATLKTVGVLGDGTNSINVGAAGAIATSGVTLDASAALGKNTFDLGTNYAAISTIKGSTGTSETVVAETLTTAATPTGWTDVNTLKFNNGSNGGTFIGSGNTSITKIVMADHTTTDLTTVNGMQGVATLTYEGTGATGVQNFSGITFVGSLSAASDTLAVNFANKGVALNSGDALNIGATNLSGAENVTIDFANGVGSAGAVTVTTGITDTTLQTLKLTNAGTGLVDVGTIAAGTATITSIDASGIAGGFKAIINNGGGFNGLASSAAILGSAGTNDIKFWDASNANSSVSLTLNGTGTQKVWSTATLNNEAFNITGGDGNFIITQDGTVTATGANALTNLSSVITLGNGNSTVFTGAGADVITVGTGTDTINAGGGQNIIRLGTGGVDTINVSVAAAAANLDTVNGFATAQDAVNVSLAGVGAFSVAAVAGTTTNAAAGNLVAQAYSGAGIANGAVTNGANIIDATGMAAQSSTTLLGLLSAGGTAIAIGNANGGAGGANFLVEYKALDGNIHLADLTLAAAGQGTTAGATALTDMVVLTGVNTTVTTATHFIA